MIWYWKFKSKKINLGFVLILIYTLVSFFSIIFYLDYDSSYNEYVGNISFWPYLFLFIVSLLFFRPFLNNNEPSIERLGKRKERLIYLFSLIYILASFITVFYQITNIISIFQGGDWLTLRNATYYDEDYKLYDSQSERFARIIASNTKLLAILIYFYYSTYLKNRLSIFKMILLLSILTPSLFTSFETAGRGSVLFLFFYFLTGYLIFKSKLSNATKLRLKYFAITLISVVLIYIISVTASRFGDQNESSIIYYISHSFMTFNYGVADSIVNYANGKYFFNNFFTDPDINYLYLGTHFGTKFITFIGTLYLDFGPVGTFLIALIVPLFMFLKKKNSNNFSSIFLYSSYYNYLISGVFVVGSGNAQKWLVIVGLFFILKTFRL